jgi:uncharacterized protein YgiM (DUF1202 family)
MEPKFNTSRDLQNRFPALAVDPRKTISTQSDLAQFDLESAEPTGPGVRMPAVQGSRIELTVTEAPKKRRRFLAKVAAFIVFICIFGGILYGTHSYLKNSGLLPGIKTMKQQTATANSDINLRPAPNINNDPIGLVTKNSKVRIVNSQNNWYQVDVVEQGRPNANQAALGRGWLNGKYLDLD